MRHDNWLMKRAQQTPEALALVFEDRSWTFAALYEDACRYLQALMSHTADLAPRRMGILANNSDDFYLMILALMQTDVEMVLLNTRLSPEELQYQIQDAEIEVLIYEGPFTETVSCLQQRVGSALLPLCLEEIRKQAQEMPVGSGCGTPTYDLERVMSILYTSGTTGHPKGVMQTYGNHYASALAGALNTGVVEDDAWVCTMPLFHISGLSILIRGLVYGCPVYLLRKFDAERVNALLCSGAGRIISVVAYTLAALLENLGEGSYPPTFRYMLLGGGFFDKGLLQKCAERGIPVIRSFGMTETCSQIIATRLSDTERKPEASGLTLLPNRLRIGEGNLPTGHPGEIQIQSPALCSGYLNQPEKYARSFTADGWYKTGDIGLMDSDGYLYVKSRLTDVIISGGENIYAVEIERCLMTYPGVAEVAVVGHAAAQWGYVPWAYLVMEEQAARPLPTAQALVDHCRAHLAGYKIPKRFIYRDALPKTSLGKIQKFKLMDD